MTLKATASDSLKTDDRKNERWSGRGVLSTKMIRFVLLHFVGLDASALQDYTFERHKTDFPNGKTGLDIFDGGGKLVFQGGEFNSGIAGYWRPSPVSIAPEWASTEKAWGRRSGP